MVQRRMDCERVLREVQILDTPFKEVVKKKSVAEKENNGLGVRYEEAYKSCIQRSSSLVQILERQDELASKLSVFQSLMESLFKALDTKRSILNQREREMEWERQVWARRLDEADERENSLTKAVTSAQLLCEKANLEQDSLITTCASLLSKKSIVQGQLVLMMESRKARQQKEREIVRLEKTVKEYKIAIKHDRVEYKENLEFSEAERAVLFEANCELESDMNRLQSQLKSKVQELERADKELSIAKTVISEKDSAIDKLKIEVQMSFQDQQQCSSCNDARQELETMATTLDKGGTGKHRELILENLALRRKLAQSERDVEKKAHEVGSLLAYIQEYKEKSVEKVDILKENLKRADGEIEELDHLVDKIRDVLHSHLPALASFPDLLALINELDGTN